MCIFSARRHAHTPTCQLLRHPFATHLHMTLYLPQTTYGFGSLLCASANCTLNASPMGNVREMSNAKYPFWHRRKNLAARFGALAATYKMCLLQIT